MSDIDTSGSEQQEGTKLDESNVVSLFKDPDPAFCSKAKIAIDKINEVKGKREELNAEKAAAVALLTNMGLNVKGVADAMVFVEMNDAKQENYDVSYKFTRQLLGLPVQGDLFEAAAQSEVRDREAAVGK